MARRPRYRGELIPTPSQCSLCARRDPDELFTCAAFPGLIPLEIRENRHDHREPWIDPDSGEPGDQGIPLAGSILFEPRDDADPGALQDLYDYLDNVTPAFSKDRSRRAK